MQINTARPKNTKSDPRELGSKEKLKTLVGPNHRCWLLWGSGLKVETTMIRARGGEGHNYRKFETLE